MRQTYFLGLAAGMTYLAHGCAGRQSHAPSAALPGQPAAQTSYKIQPIIKLGDRVGDVLIGPRGDFDIGTLNDSGQLIFRTINAGPYGLIQYADRKLVPIVVEGKDAPGGKWTGQVYPPVSMNHLGNVAFSADVLVGEEVVSHVPSTFLWDAKAHEVVPVLLKGVSAANNLTFQRGGRSAPMINSRNEMAVVATVTNAEGRYGEGVFFLERDGKPLPVAFPGQELPGGVKIGGATQPSINDAGVVAFLAEGPGGRPLSHSGYLWEKGKITPVAMVGTHAPGWGTFRDVFGLWVNSKNHNALVAAHVGQIDLLGTGHSGLYLFASGVFIPVAVDGRHQEMPGGGNLKGFHGVSFANDSGQHAFLAVLEDGSTAAYLMDADGKLSLILKSGTTTDLGQITTVGSGYGVGLNNKGQVAVTVRINDGVDTIALLTPAAS